MGREDEHVTVEEAEEPGVPARPSPSELDWASSLRRAALRAGVVALGLSVILAVTFLVLFSLLLCLDGLSRPGPLEVVRIVGVLLLSSLAGLLVALPLFPLAFLDVVAAGWVTRRSQVLASLGTVPLTLLLLFVLTVQGTYTVHLLDTRSFERASDRALRAARELSDIDPEALLAILALVVPVPLATLTRLRRLAHRDQLKWTLGGTVVVSGSLLLLAGLADGRGIRDDEVLLGTCLLGLALFLATLLPGAYARADGAERRLTAWLRKD